MTIKQQIHNWLFGEQLREANRDLYMTDDEQVELLATSLVSPDTNRIWGVDISPWDGNVQLSITKGFGASFVFIKGLDGSVRVKYFSENRARAIEAGLLHAPYQWLYKNANVPCVKQAQAMDSLLQQYPSDLPPVVDLEWTKWAGQASNPNYSDLDLWVTELLRLGHRKPIMYSAKGYMDLFGKMPAALKDKFSAFWFANYGVANPLIPAGFTVWDFWQFSASGDAQKYTPNDSNKKELDLNYYYGDMVELYTLANAVPPIGGNMWKKATGNITMRTAPNAGASNATINGANQYVLTGDVLDVDTLQNGFAHIVRLYRNDLLIELPPVAWAGTQYMQDTTYTPPAIPSTDDTVEIFINGQLKVSVTGKVTIS